MACELCICAKCTAVIAQVGLSMLQIYIPTLYYNVARGLISDKVNSPYFFVYVHRKKI